MTGERAAFRTVAAKYNCTSFECRTFEETKCAPFEVSVRAFNRNGPSNSTVQQIGDEKGLSLFCIFSVDFHIEIYMILQL